MTLRDYQEPAVKVLSVTKRGIVKAPAGSGKTIIGAAALAQWSFPRHLCHNRKMKIAWVANTNEQVDQAKAACARFDIIARAAAVDYFCYAGAPSMAGYDLAILDECHHCAAPEYRKMLDYHEGARWGLSATPDRADDLKKDVYALIGQIVYTVERARLVEVGQLAKAIVYIHTTNTKGEFEKQIDEIVKPEYEKRKKRWPYLFYSPTKAKEQMNRLIWQAALDVGIFANESRNEKATQLALHHANDSTLMLVAKIEHGEMLASKIPGSQMVYSKMGAKRRRAAIECFASGEIRCMVATSLADEGLDVPRANVLIQVSAGRSAAKAEQRTGRVLRAFHDLVHGTDKQHGVIHDFSDIQHYFLAAQARQRIAVYSRLDYKITNL